MTIRAILRFPDPRLRLAAAPIVAFDETLAALADELLAAMRAAPGIGITAPHIGVLLRLVVIELSAADGARIYANPCIEWASAERARHEEGSVSMPGVIETIERPARVRLRYQDLTGATRVEEADGLLAVCLQHEIDQLDGMFWIQRLSKLKRDRVAKRFEKMGRAG
ncbi:peptide deformylase [Methylocapsa sp. S129]|uniref:peptide deformylase n=1 Tax=Methylocapsa sp. S129 TaxID=1641869 RepID=UPI001FED2E19|nr:peptide deformylase [Methylocapsa sp. S129]